MQKSPVAALRSIALLGMLAFSGAVSAAPVPIIFDTDMDSDCDDAAALAMLHALADKGEAQILGTMVSSKFEWSAPCVDAINTYFKRPDLPIGVPHSPSPKLQGSKYAQQIAREFPHDMKPFAQAPDATPIYRKLLANQADGSVVIVTVGDVTNIRYLLESKPDEISPLDGTELCKRKVKQWVCMGTRYPSDMDTGRWGNFKIDPESTVKAIANWPGLITFTGGQEFAQSLATGKRLIELPKENPVRRVYELYFDGTVKERHSADQIAVYVAIRGSGAPWKLVKEGYNFIFPDGRHEWRETPDNPNQEYISALADGTHPKEVAALMEELMLHLPKE
jgi:hypothetical protein